MRARGHLRSQTTNEFLTETRKWDLDGDVVEHQRGCHDPEKVITIELSLQQLGRLADILRHAGNVKTFDLEKGYHLKDVIWTSYENRVEFEKLLAERRSTSYPQTDS